MEPPQKSLDERSFVFHKGAHVVKFGGDYTFDGIVVAAFRKRSGATRYVVENSAGILHIFKASQLEDNNG